MNSIIFQHHTVLSDVHMLLPNACHLMRRLNRVGQPVFLSKFEILCNGQKDASKDSTKESVKECEEKDNQEEDDQKDTKCKQEKHEEEEERNTPVVLDEDGDLDVTHRPTKNPDHSGRDLVNPVILCQSDPVWDPEEENTDDDDTVLKDVIRIGTTRKYRKYVHSLKRHPKTELNGF